MVSIILIIALAALIVALYFARTQFLGPRNNNGSSAFAKLANADKKLSTIKAETLTKQGEVQDVHDDLDQLHESLG